MGFKYVFIPASASEEMKELVYEEDIAELEKDSFRPFLEKYFAGITHSLDRELLVKQLQERTGVNLNEHKGADLDRLLSSTSVEIFPVQLPTKDTGFNSVSVYCDDKGIAKNLEENPRMSGIAHACGFVGQTFRGDCFVGRVYDDTEDEWRRIDFSLEDVRADAPWVLATKKQRSNRSSSDMGALANMAGMKNAVNINSSAMEADAPQGETEQYCWRQADEEVEVTFKKEGLQKGDKSQVKVKFAKQRLRVEVKGEVLIDAELYSSTTPDESTWSLSDGVLQVTLFKAEGGTWDRLLKAA
mmetsp:Transcript_58484/g.163925  ORF Transcript_58484/g.163925 Transcript_58484/m.163925 type:complete len:300 (-) Transcript_58484:81-980(-)